jgi:hypothetical protein
MATVWLVYDLHAPENPDGPKLVCAPHSSLKEARDQAAAHVSGELVGVYSKPLTSDRKPQGKKLWPK